MPGFGGTQMLPRLAARRARAGGGQIYTLLVDGAGRAARRPPPLRAERTLALGLVDEVAPADALSHALGVAAPHRARRVRRRAVVAARPARRPLAFPNVERDPEIQRLLAHHARVPAPRPGPRDPRARAARVSPRGSTAGLAAEAREFGRLVASDDGRAGLDRFLARHSLPLPLRRDDLS